MKKRCSKCKNYKKLHLFYKHSQCKDGLRPECKSCYKNYNKQLYRKRKDAYHDNLYKKTYGISFEDYGKLLKKQNNKCAICGRDNSNRKQDRKFHIDHCHKTKKVRGLLCHSCNVGLGHLKDSIKLLKKAEKYLKGELKCQK